MTRLVKTLTRETDAFDRADRIVIELSARSIELRLKGAPRTKEPPLSIGIEALYHLLCRNRADAQRLDRMRRPA